jgi:hypothetical protein
MTRYLRNDTAIAKIDIGAWLQVAVRITALLLKIPPPPNEAAVG